MGFNFTPAYGATFIFDGGSIVDPQDWFLGDNWDLNVIPGVNDIVRIGSFSPPPTFDVNIGDGTIPGANTFTSTGPGSFLQILDGNTLTIKEFSFLINDDSGGLFSFDPGSIVTVDGTLTNLLVSDSIRLNGLLVITDTGLVENFGDINGFGEIQCVGNGTFDQLGTIDGTITVTGCGGAAVGSISIPIDTTPMLVAGNQFDSMWLLPAIAAAIGVGVILVRRN